MTHVKGSDDEQRIGDENKEKKRTARKQEQIWLLVRAAMRRSSEWKDRKYAWKTSTSRPGKKSTATNES